MKSNNLFRIIWIVGIYAVLAIILYLVVIYKVKWEDRDLNQYLYFYQCDGNLCTATINPGTYYNRVVCNDKICPYIKYANKNLVILKDTQKEYIYNYITDTIVNNDYISYKLTSDDNYIVNDGKKYGVIDSEGTILIDLSNQKIIDYKNGFIIYEENKKYGIINESKKININPVYEDVVLINENMYGYLEDGNYYIASYDTELPIYNDTYDYIYSINNHILTFKNKQINILNENLKSSLIMKIDSFYQYKIEKERETLNIHKGDNFIEFKVYTDESSYLNYIYDTKNNKLYY